jgi:hypothetical protein
MSDAPTVVYFANSGIDPIYMMIHPLAEKFPAMPPADFEKLKESIAKYGLFEPIVINEFGQILEGRHRYKALVDLGKDPWKNSISFTEVKGENEDLTEEQFIYDSNVHRRHLTDDQKAMLAAEFAPYFKKEAEKRKAGTQFAGRAPDGTPVTKSGSSVDSISGPPKNRDIEAKHANSTAGLVAEKADVSEYKATQALAVLQCHCRSENPVNSPL